MKRLGLLICFAIAPFGLAQETYDEHDWRHLSYEKLRCPKGAPDDPKAPNTKGRMAREWSQTCRNSQKMECFFKRHANSWQITCSLCVKEKCCSKPMDVADDGILELVATQKKIGGKTIEMAYSPYFCVLMDHRSLKIKTRGGAPRVARKHELLHLMLQRAEMARMDFEKTFGQAYQGRSVMMMSRSDSVQRAFSQHYFGHQRTNILRGYGSGNKIVNGLCGNGFSITGKSDDDLHFRMRHMIGHLLITTYNGANPHEKYCPAWLDKGAAHWLCKLHPRAKNYATFCQHEGAVSTSGGSRGSPRGGSRTPGGGGGGGGGPTVSGSGAKWHVKAKKIALRGPRKDPVEKMFRASTIREVNFDLHVRGWSWFDVFAREEKEKFVQFVQALRQATDPRIAAKQAWGQPPEKVDERWREFVLGKRRKVEATEKEQEKEGDVDAATAQELADLARETDVQLIAGRIRGLERCQNVKSARLLVELADKRDSDRVRTAIALVLGRTESDEVKAYLRGAGYEKAGKMGRAIVCRTIGDLGDKEAVEVIRTGLDDSFWLVKANAMRALAQLEDEGSIDRIAKIAANDPVGKVRIAAMDSLAVFGEAARETAPVFQDNLKHSAWQIKVATCDVLKVLGNTKPMDLLIDRYEIEGGRVKEDVLETMQALTGMERKWSPNTWREWWKKARKWKDLEEKSRKELGKEGPAPKDDRYAEQKKKPHYYGIRIYARTVGYVLDISASMDQGFKLSPEWEQKLGHKINATTRIGVSREEIAHSIAGLDPRTRINLVFFNSRARLWKKTPVAAGSAGASAIAKVKNIATKGQTNYYDALRLILGMEGGAGGWVSGFADTPDTLFFLTDGSPTDGEITKADELLAWFQERNRFARLRVHVIAMGRTGVDLEFLQNLAERNRGRFVHLTGDY
ncbi:MAG: HEAT repeat domain-containing protein [Planctomycetota bacterium]